MHREGSFHSILMLYTVYYTLLRGVIYIFIHMTNRLNRGFTLIELLVVIAIIGILSSVVLASLNTARGKGANAAVKANLNNIRAQAELDYDNAGGSYAGVCTEAQFAKGLAAAVSAGGGVSACNAAAGYWVASTALKVPEGSSNYWCVDSTGDAKGEAAALGALTVCA